MAKNIVSEVIKSVPSSVKVEASYNGAVAIVTAETQQERDNFFL